VAAQPRVTMRGSPCFFVLVEEEEVEGRERRSKGVSQEESCSRAKLFSFGIERATIGRKQCLLLSFATLRSKKMSHDTAMRVVGVAEGDARRSGCGEKKETRDCKSSARSGAAATTTTTALAIFPSCSHLCEGHHLDGGVGGRGDGHEGDGSGGGGDGSGGSLAEIGRDEEEREKRVSEKGRRERDRRRRLLRMRPHIPTKRASLRRLNALNRCALNQSFDLWARGTTRRVAEG